MENDFKRVHTRKDLTISTIVLLIGIGLFFISKTAGVFIAICGLMMFIIYRTGYKKDGHGVILTRKTEDLCKACRQSLIEFLGGKDTTPCIKKGHEGGCIHLDVYYNKESGIAYAQLYDFCNYSYEPATMVVELNGDRMNKLVSLL